MFSRIRRLVGIILILCAVLVTQFPSGEAYASYAKEDFLLNKDILSKYTGTASTVSVPDNVRYIGEEAFISNHDLDYVILSKNLKGIEHGAFSDCIYLNRVIIPDSVKYIDTAAFSGCTSLQNITFGKNIEELGDAVFAGCKDLVSVSIPKENPHFMSENGALYDDKQEYLYAYLCGNSYDTYKMPNSVKHISQYSFFGNEDLIDVYLSSYLEEVPGYSFSNCKNLSHVQIPYSVNSIDAHAFENCISLKDVQIPPSVTYIDPTAFDGCYNLNIIATEGSAAYEFWQNYDRSDIAFVEKQDAKSIYKNVNPIQKQSTGLIDASKDPSNVEYNQEVYSQTSFDDSSVLGKARVIDGEAVFFIGKDMPVKDLETYDAVSDGMVLKLTQVDNKLAGLAYYGSKGLEQYELPKDITDIGRFAFARSDLKSISIPQGVKTIGYGAFYHCDDLYDVDIPGSVETIEGYAFDNTPFLQSFKNKNVSDEYLIVGDGLLLSYVGYKSDIVIPSNVKKICSAAFMGNEYIESVFIPDSVISIEPDAFRGCKNLNAVKGASNVRYIGDRAFMDCPIDSFLVGGKVERMGLRAIDFSTTDKDDSSKVVVFSTDKLPTVDADPTSRRLSNDSYREDVLYNCLYAVVDESIELFDNTVLDGERLGFSGLVVSLQKDSTGRNTGLADVKANYIFSDEVLRSIPNTFEIDGTRYLINDFDKLTVASEDRDISKKSKQVEVQYDGEKSDKYSALFSQNESVGKLVIEDSENASLALIAAYSNINKDEPNLIGAYDMKLYDKTGSITIDRFGKASLYITIPVLRRANYYQVVTLDEDGQLEDLNAVYNDKDNTLTFETSHLSYIGIFGTQDKITNGDAKDSKSVDVDGLDISPDTGDNSIPIKYVIAVAIASVGILLVLIKPKRPVNASDKS